VSPPGPARRSGFWLAYSVAIQLYERATREMRTSSMSPSNSALQPTFCCWSPWPIQTCCSASEGEMLPVLKGLVIR
jgi:hypothetical protein